MNQAIYVNGRLIAQNIKREAPGQEYKLDHAILRPGENIYAIIGPPLVKRHRWEDLNTDPGIIRVHTPPPAWRRSVFNGLAQVIVQSTQQPGEIILTATAPGLSIDKLKLKTLATTLRLALPAK